MAEEVGFEPTRAMKTLAIFKTAPFIRSGTPPHYAGLHRSNSRRIPYEPDIVIIAPAHSAGKWASELAWGAVPEYNTGLGKRIYLAGPPCTVRTLSGTGDYQW
jgi:hypothetical protein